MSLKAPKKRNPEDICRPVHYNRRKIREVVCLFAEPKMDGRWTAIQREEGEPWAYGYKVSNITGELIHVPVRPATITRWIKIPQYTIIEGELIYPGHVASDVVTGIAESPEELKFIPFTAPYLCGEDLRKEEYAFGRTALLEHVGEDLMPMVGGFNYAPVREEALALVNMANNPLIEGVVLKQKWYSKWWKIKPPRAAYVICTQIHTGVMGRLYGKPNAIQVAAEGRDMGSVGSGFDDVERAELSIMDIGRVLEVRYDAISPYGKLIRPRFWMWRDEINVSACMLTQFGDAFDG